MGTVTGCLEEREKFLLILRVILLVSRKLIIIVFPDLSEDENLDVLVDTLIARALEQQRINGSMQDLAEGWRG